jgi:hypothetical protein
VNVIRLRNPGASPRYDGDGGDGALWVRSASAALPVSGTTKADPGRRRHGADRRCALRLLPILLFESRQRVPPPLPSWAPAGDDAEERGHAPCSTLHRHPVREAQSHRPIGLAQTSGTHVRPHIIWPTRRCNCEWLFDVATAIDSIERSSQPKSDLRCREGQARRLADVVAHRF